MAIHSGTSLSVPAAWARRRNMNSLRCRSFMAAPDIGLFSAMKVEHFAERTITAPWAAPPIPGCRSTRLSLHIGRSTQAASQRPLGLATCHSNGFPDEAAMDATQAAEY